MLNALFLDPEVSGGTETYLRGLAPALHDLMPDTTLVIATTRRGARALRGAGWDAWSEIVELPCDVGQSGRRMLAEQVLLPMAAWRRHVDLLHSLASIGPVWTPWLRHVATLHDVTVFHETAFGRLSTAAFRAVIRGVALDVDAAITGTASAGEDIATVLNLNPAGFVVAHHGRVPVLPKAGIGNAVSHRLGLNGSRIALCVSGKRPHKNQELLLRAWRQLPADVRLVLVGHPTEPYDTMLRQLVTAEGIENRVTFLDYIPDAELEALWEVADCAALPTKAEGFGLPVIEAMERGVPVACSDLPVLREVGGDVPRYFSVDDPSQCAAAILEAMVGDDRRELGRQRATSFTWDGAARSTLRAYDRALQCAPAFGRGRALVRPEGGQTTTDWIDVIRGRDRSVLGRLATAGKQASIPPTAHAAGLLRRMAGVRTFNVGGRTLEYAVHPYNETWRNERAVELPLAFDWLDRRPSGPVLEIGHVLGHYRRGLAHTVVDLYEPAQGVVNVDALDYAPAEQFRSIIAVSTLEHVGFDEDDQDPDKTRRLVEHLATLLTDDGELMVTFPLGYNRFLDDHLLAGALGFDKVTVLRRLTTMGEWIESHLDAAPRARYGFPFHYGNMIAVGYRAATPDADGGGAKPNVVETGDAATVQH